jgi:stage V sporulation protein AF
VVKYIHSGDHVEVNDHVKDKQADSGEKGSVDIQPGEAEAAEEMGVLLDHGQTVPEGDLSTTGDGSPDHEDEEPKQKAGPEASGSSDTEADRPQVDRSASPQGEAEPDLSGVDEVSASKQSSEQSGKEYIFTLLDSDSETEGTPETETSGNQDAEASAELGTDIGVDAGATGYSDHDLQVSDGAGTPDQEGPDSQQEEEPEVQGSSDTEESLEADAKEPEGAESTGEGNPETDSKTLADSEKDENGDPDGQAQDAEASSELGTEEPEPAKRGFFARLFGDDPETEEEESAEDPEMDKQGKEQAEAESGGQKDQAGKSKTDKKQAQSQEPKKADPKQKKRDTEHSNSLEQSIIYWQGNDKIPERLEDTKATLTEVLGLGSSFDIVFREMSFGGRRAALLCISGFAKDTIIDEILKRLTYLTPDDISADVLASFMSEYIPHVQVEKGDLLSESVNKVLSGMSVFFIEGETQVIIMDTRSYPSRSPDEPSIERVVRGARDGFTETLLSNVALVRRRIRDPGLKYEMHQVGRRTRTDVCVAYIDDIVDKTQVKAVTDKIKSIDIDGIPLADKQLEEAIVGRGWNPYPLVRYSERPDTVASHLLEGRVVIFVDTSPSVIVLPTTFFDLCQHAEENRQTPFMGTYLRWVRFIGVFASMFLLPLWMLLVIHPELKPAMLDFIGPQKMAKIPLLAQFLIVELGVDLLRMAAVHTPTPLGSAMGLIAAILVGDIAVQTGLFVNEVVLYMAVASIGMFATPSYELGLANRIVRLGLLLAVAAFQVQGFMIGTTLLIVLLTMHRSYNSSYLWPFIPFNAKAFGAILVRQPVLSAKTRPSFNKTRDNTRMPPVQENDQ